MPVTENATSHSQRLLTNLQGLQRRVSERLAEREAELRELSGADTRLDELQQELDVLRPDPRRWSAERQALMDRRDELSRAIAIAEAHGKQTVETATENARRLQEELEQARALVLRTQQELADQESAHLTDQAGTAQRRERLANDLSQAQAQVAALAADKERQDDDLAALLARVGTLEQQLQEVADAEAEVQDAPTDPRDVAEKQQQLDLVSDEIRRQRDAVAALRTAVGKVFEAYCGHLDCSEIIAWFNDGGTLRVGDSDSAALCLKGFRTIDGLLKAAAESHLAEASQADVLVAACELILEGLHAQKKISRNEERGYTAVKPEPRGYGYESFSRSRKIN